MRTNGGAGKNPHDKRIKRTVGRPIKLNQELIDLAVSVIQNGALLAMVPAAMGINASTFYDWQKRGKREEERLKSLETKWADMDAEARAEARKKAREEKIFVTFSNSVENAIYERDKALMNIIHRAANGAPKLVRKVKKELRTTAAGTPDEPILDSTLIVTEETETRTVEYDWRAAQYLLEKGQPQLFGPRATIDVRKALPTDPGALADMELPELLELARQLEEALDGAVGSE